MEVERYNYVFDQYDGDSFIYDVQTNEKIEFLSTCADLLNQQDQKISNLEAKLAEKDDLLKTYTQLNEDLAKRLDNRCDICIERHKQSQNQIAIKELEKVKELLKHKGLVLKVKPPIELPTIKGQEYLNQFYIFVEDFDRIFDQQIKSLKGESK